VFARDACLSGQAFLDVVFESLFKHVCGVNLGFVGLHDVDDLCHVFGFETIEFVQFSSAFYGLIYLFGLEFDDHVFFGKAENFWKKGFPPSSGEHLAILNAQLPEGLQVFFFNEDACNDERPDDAASSRFINTRN
jgi:uncharacterized membrane protein YuzA (DUF378 family)